MFDQENGVKLQLSLMKNLGSYRLLTGTRMEEKTNSKLPAKRKQDPRVKHTLWIDFKTVKLDGRTALAKAISAMKGKLVKQLGGNPSIGETLLIDRVVHKAIKAHIYEINFFSNRKQGSKDHYLALVNSLRLDLQALGLKQNGGKILDLNEYMREKAKGRSPTE